ncbi:MAG: 8-amino-7-oxononanoate synthase [Flavobacteriales bacterium]|nr:8-amino-7-oxononanoate synthase [Flavobacteriales bacterium]
MADLSLNDLLGSKLHQRKESGLLRQLRVAEGKTDFCSNDYLGLARSNELKLRISEAEGQEGGGIGSTGSRLLSGHSRLSEQLEQRIAEFHGSPTALLFNSGYDANVGLFSSLGRVSHTIVYDELIHASVHDGIRLSKATGIAFRHNDPQHLDQILSAVDGHSVVAVESIYSMDGDACDLRAMADVCDRHGASLIVDEAHAVGLFGQQGRGLVHAAGLEGRVFARLMTYGKALGCHGAAVLGSDVLRQFLINYARPLIYSTFTSRHALLSIKCAYDMLSVVDDKRQITSHLTALLKHELSSLASVHLIPSNSPIQGLVVPGAARCRAVAQQVWDDGFDIRPIVQPTVPMGSERIRICLHAFNTEAEVMALAGSLRKALEMNS